ncbi:MAG: hypothetical protein F6K19_01460 [Cyanothece sp. SIO1E1]|nr:hypothetical protein [Cyanothece sp. SIO1E1]
MKRRTFIRNSIIAASAVAVPLTVESRKPLNPKFDTFRIKTPDTEKGETCWYTKEVDIAFKKHKDMMERAFFSPLLSKIPKI